MKNGIVSIIVPVYNVENYVNQCIESITMQTYKELEIILIDDGSTDCSGHICEEWKCKDERIVVEHKAHGGGVSSARNAGLKMVSGRFLCFVDSDDWLERETISIAMDGMNHQDIDIVCIARRKIRDGLEIQKCFSYYPDGTILTGKQVAAVILTDKMGSQVWQGLYRKECWKGISFPEGRIYEDIATTFKAFYVARQVYFTDKAVYNYRMNKSGISHTPNPNKNYHIFLGFKEHFEFADSMCKSVAGECSALAAHYAITTYIRQRLLNKEEQNKKAIEDVVDYLKENKSVILNNRKCIPFSRRIFLYIFWWSESGMEVLLKVLKREVFKRFFR